LKPSASKTPEALGIHFNMMTHLPTFFRKASGFAVAFLALGSFAQQANAQMGATPRISLSLGGRALALSNNDATPTASTFYGPTAMLHIQSGNLELGLGAHSALNEADIFDANVNQSAKIKSHIIPTARISGLLFRDAIFTPMAYAAAEVGAADIDINEGNAPGANNGTFKQATVVVGLGARVKFSGWFVQADAGFGLSQLKIEGAPFTTRKYNSVNAGDFALRLGYMFGAKN